MTRNGVRQIVEIPDRRVKRADSDLSEIPVADEVSIEWSERHWLGCRCNDCVTPREIRKSAQWRNKYSFPVWKSCRDPA